MFHWTMSLQEMVREQLVLWSRIKTWIQYQVSSIWMKTWFSIKIQMVLQVLIQVHVLKSMTGSFRAEALVHMLLSAMVVVSH